MNKTFSLIVVAVSCVMCVIIIRTWTLSFRSDRVRPCKSSDADFIAATDDVISRFQQALRFKTVSLKPHVYDTEQLGRFGKFIGKGN